MSEIINEEEKDLAEVYRKKRRSGVVNLHLLNLKLEKEKPLCFVEGEDSKYYRIRVELITSKEPYFIKCEGKQGVIDSYNKIKSSSDYNEYKLFFFVDSDFDEKINNIDIYETPCYSVENLYTTENSFRKILIDEFNLTDEDPDFQKCLDIFNKRASEFHETIIELNAWISCLMDLNKRRDAESKIKNNLKNLTFKRDIAQVFLDKVNPKWNLNNIEKKLNITESVDPEDLMKKVDEFINKGNYGLTFRGKFELEFFITLINRMQEDCNKDSSRFLFQKKGNCTLRLEGNVLSSLSHYALTPQCLTDYIEFIWTREGVAV